MRTIPATLDPTLDKATVLRLRTSGVQYVSTHWSRYWNEWEHRIIITTERGHRHTLIKNDQGIAALLVVTNSEIEATQRQVRRPVCDCCEADVDIHVLFDGTIDCSIPFLPADQY